MKTRAFVATLAVFAGAGGALALDAKVTKDTPATAEAAWAAIGDFCGIGQWHPVVEKCEISGKDGAIFRTLYLKGGGKILEKQIAFDAAKMSYSYTIEESQLPVKNYKSTMRVAAKDTGAKGGGATIEWSGNFDAKDAPDADAIKTMTGVYQAGIDALVAKTSK
jgi:Polyketide cyclase / dehydrase and lipid transport